MADPPYSTRTNQQSYQQFLWITVENGCAARKLVGPQISGGKTFVRRPPYNQGKYCRALSPNWAHGARLRALIAELFVKGNFRADLQVCETIIKHAVFVEIQLATIASF